MRYYEAQGLLEPERSANGYREYPDEAVHVVRQIRALLDERAAALDSSRQALRRHLDATTAG